MAWPSHLRALGFYLTLLTTLPSVAEPPAGNAPLGTDNTAYKNTLRGVDQGYQDALTRNGTDARYNQAMELIDNTWDRTLAALGFGPSRKIQGHFGKPGGTNTDVAVPLIGPAPNSAPAQEAPPAKIIGIAR